MYITIDGLDGLRKSTIVEEVRGLFDKIVVTPSGVAREFLTMDAPARDMLLLLDHVEIVNDLSYTDNIIQDRSIVSNFGYMEHVTPAEYSRITRNIRRPNWRIVVTAGSADVYLEHNNKIKSKDNIESMPIERHMEIEQRMISFVISEEIPFIIIPVSESDAAISLIREKLELRI